MIPNTNDNIEQFGFSLSMTDYYIFSSPYRTYTTPTYYFYSGKNNNNNNKVCAHKYGGIKNGRYCKECDEETCKNPKCEDDEYFNITEITCQSKKWMKQNVTQNMEMIHMDVTNAITMNVLNVFKI